MSSARTIRTNISVDNVKSFIIAGLYSLGAVKKDEDILDISFGKAEDGLGLSQFKEWRADRVMPLEIKIRKEVREDNAEEKKKLP